MSMKDYRIRVVVCGVTFGRIYIDAILKLKRKYKLVGLVAKGSDLAREYARRLEVPLFTEVESVNKEDVDLACVVIRSGAVGGKGTEIALELLAKGINVIQEQPIRLEEISKCIRMANKTHSIYYLNCFYSDVITTQKLLHIVQLLRGHTTIRHIEATTSIHVLFPMIDILGKITNGFRPWNFKKICEIEGPCSYTIWNGKIKDISIMIKIYNEMDFKNPDNYMRAFHRFIIECDSGSLIMDDTHGNISWRPMLYMKRQENKEFIIDDNCYGEIPISEKIFEAKNYCAKDIFEFFWPQALVNMLLYIHEIIKNTNERINTQYIISVCEIWEEIGGNTRSLPVCNSERLEPLQIRNIVEEGLYNAK